MKNTENSVEKLQVSWFFHALPFKFFDGQGWPVHLFPIIIALIDTDQKDQAFYLYLCVHNHFSYTPLSVVAGT